jgi:hypothetical protein
VRRAAPALIAAAALAGCGGSGAGEEATALLERGFATDVDTGVLTLETEIELEGSEEVDGPLRFTLEGPFRAADAPTGVPDLDMDFRASGAGQELDGRVVVTRENAWVEFRGTTYEVGEELWARLIEALRAQPQGPESLREAGIDPLDWVEDAEREGEEKLGGTATTKVRATLDVERILRDFNELVPESGGRIPEGAIEEIDDVVEDVDFEAWIGEDDIWRRVASEVEFDVPENRRDEVGGLEGGSVSLDVELDDPNEPVDIEGPAEGRPIDELLRRLGIPPQLFLGPGFSAPSPG